MLDLIDKIIDDDVENAPRSLIDSFDSDIQSNQDINDEKYREKLLAVFLTDYDQSDKWFLFWLTLFKDENLEKIEFSNDEIIAIMQIALTRRDDDPSESPIRLIERLITAFNLVIDPEKNYIAATVPDAYEKDSEFFWFTDDGFIDFLMRCNDLDEKLIKSIFSKIEFTEAFLEAPFQDITKHRIIGDEFKSTLDESFIKQTYDVARLPDVIYKSICHLNLQAFELLASNSSVFSITKETLLLVKVILSESIDEDLRYSSQRAVFENRVDELIVQEVSKEAQEAFSKQFKDEFNQLIKPYNERVQYLEKRNAELEDTVRELKQSLGLLLSKLDNSSVSSTEVVTPAERKPSASPQFFTSLDIDDPADNKQDDSKYQKPK